MRIRILDAGAMCCEEAGLGLSPVCGTPEQLDDEMRKALDAWRMVVQEAGVDVN